MLLFTVGNEWINCEQHFIYKLEKTDERSGYKPVDKQTKKKPDSCNVLTALAASLTVYSSDVEQKLLGFSKFESHFIIKV